MSSADLTEKLERLRGLLEKATPGPWFEWPCKDGGRVCANFPVEGEEPLSIADFDMDTRLDYDTQSCANAALTSAMKNTLPDLLARIEADAKRMGEMREALKEADELIAPMAACGAIVPDHAWGDDYYTLDSPDSFDKAEMRFPADLLRRAVEFARARAALGDA